MAGAGRGKSPTGEKTRDKRASSAKKTPAVKAPSSGPSGRAVNGQNAAKAPAGVGDARESEKIVEAAPGGVPAPLPASAPPVAPPAGAATAAGLPVRADEERWRPAELAEVRAGLEEQIAALRAEIAASASQIAEGDASEGAGDDQADAGAKTYAREHELALSYNSQDLLAQNERAVQRMDAGTYGICESCGKPIGKARLQAFPRATLCVTCKQREERR